MTNSLHEIWQHRHTNENKQRRDDHRSVYERDRARILHSAAFRRLQAKTQVHGAGMNDFYRTRLTHSLEAAQVGAGIVTQLKIKQPEFTHLLPSNSLIESLCLAHDIGHPPFGHGGEVALNYMMRNHGGFEGNAQTFRIVTRLEPYTPEHGMNLTRRTLLGLMKYPALLSAAVAPQRPNDIENFRCLVASQWQPAKGIYDCDNALFNWVIAPLGESEQQHLSTLRPSNEPNLHRKTLFKSFDCSIMELADDIAYSVHDLEDAIVMGIVSRHQWQELVASQLIDCGDLWIEQHIDKITQSFFGQPHERKDAIGSLVNALITAIHIEPTTSVNNDQQLSPLLRWQATLSQPMTLVLNALKQFVYRFVVMNHDLQLFEYKGQQIIMALFEAIEADPIRLLPESTRQRWVASGNDPRVIADYIAGMTDGYAQRLHSALFDASLSQGIHRPL
ncbi:anti-phage deoxyguanosine triphosphatase [Thaumasiovibrio sp. DFM-14]|uniref:anti-phage deoxyguanosine triphosphatase n=1 Tax=Thaumasiovibrio sp. DFM-14 TaxID=3384792 RepID=UPI0039A0ADF4